MNGAEARAYRELLNFDQAELARLHGMSQKSLQYRESINKEIFPDVAEYLTNAKAEWDQQVDAIIDAHEGDAEVTLCAYQDREFDSAGKLTTRRKTYNAAVAYAAVELQRNGTRVTIEWAEPE